MFPTEARVIKNQDVKGNYKWDITDPPFLTCMETAFLNSSHTWHDRRHVKLMWDVHRNVHFSLSGHLNQCNTFLLLFHIWQYWCSVICERTTEMWTFHFPATWTNAKNFCIHVISDPTSVVSDVEWKQKCAVAPFTCRPLEAMQSVCVKQPCSHFPVKDHSIPCLILTDTLPRRWINHSRMSPNILGDILRFNRYKSSAWLHDLLYKTAE